MTNFSRFSNLVKERKLSKTAEDSFKKSYEHALTIKITKVYFGFEQNQEEMQDEEDSENEDEI